MPIDSLSIWLDEFEKIPQDPTGDLAPKYLAEFVDKRVTEKLDTDSKIVKWNPPPTYKWKKEIFEAVLRIICKAPVNAPLLPAIKMADAWQKATLASTFLIEPNAKMNPPFPATNGIGAAPVAIIDPASVALAYAYLVAQLSSVLPVPQQRGAVFPRAVRQAFLMLTYTITGIDTKPPPTGPIPFTYPLTPVI